jgi:hypothetical protein
MSSTACSYDPGPKRPVSRPPADTVGLPPPRRATAGPPPPVPHRWSPRPGDRPWRAPRGSACRCSSEPAPVRCGADPPPPPPRPGTPHGGARNPKSSGSPPRHKGASRRRCHPTAPAQRPRPAPRERRSRARHRETPPATTSRWRSQRARRPIVAPTLPAGNPRPPPGVAQPKQLETADPSRGRAPAELPQGSSQRMSARSRGLTIGPRSLPSAIYGSVASSSITSGVAQRSGSQGWSVGPQTHHMGDVQGPTLLPGRWGVRSSRFRGRSRSFSECGP